MASNKKIKKIVVVGPESTGKSTLCRSLAEHYNSIWCPEYARHYLLANGMKYSYDDLLTIAKGQLALEDEYTQQLLHMISYKNEEEVTPLFIDTNMYVMKVWCEFVFGKCHQFILDQIVEREYDGYLLCNTDLPWVKDELREYPDLHTREVLFNIYKDIMVDQTAPWFDIKGTAHQRVLAGIEATNKIL